MSKRLTHSHRKCKTVAKECQTVGPIGRPSTRRSIRKNPLVATDAGNTSHTSATSCAPSVATKEENLCEYYPSRKRCQPSPRSHTHVKYTRIKSPRAALKTLSTGDAFIGYGDDDLYDQQNECYSLPTAPPVVIAGAGGGDRTTAATPQQPLTTESVDYQSLLDIWKTAMDEKDDEEEDITETLPDYHHLVTEFVGPMTAPVISDELAPPSLPVVTNTCPTIVDDFDDCFGGDDDFFDDCVDNKTIACEVASSDDRKSNTADTEPEVCVVFNTNDSELVDTKKSCDEELEAFDDSFDNMCSQIDFTVLEPKAVQPIDSVAQTVANDMTDCLANKVSDSVANNVVISADTDDGFGSDDDSFGQMLSQMPNEELLTICKPQAKDTDSGLDLNMTHMNTSSTSTANSTSSLMTLSQILQLINSP